MNPTLTIEQIAEKYRGKMYRLALSISRNEKDAEDIIQNALVKILEHLRTFRHESNIATWIYKITYNEALMFLRKKKTLSRLSRNVQAQPEPMTVSRRKLPDAELVDSELRERLYASINRMPIQYRMPLLLAKVEDLPLKQSAEILHLKIPSLKTRLHRAFLMLRDEIKGYLEDHAYTEPVPDACCRKMVRFLYDYVEGGLRKKKREAFDDHLSDCPSCKMFMKTYTKAISLTRGLQCRDMPEGLKDKIMSFLKGKC